MFFVKLIVAISIWLGLYGCASIVMPYHEDPLCKRGVAGGYCGNLTEIDDYVEQKYLNKKNRRAVK